MSVTKKESQSAANACRSPALLLAKRAEGKEVGYWYLVGGGTCLLLTRVVATTTGIAFANVIPEPRAIGMDFAFTAAFTAAFIAIARSLWSGRQDLLPWFVAALVVVIVAATQIVDSTWAMVTGGICGAAVAGIRRSG